MAFLPRAAASRDAKTPNAAARIKARALAAVLAAAALAGLAAAGFLIKDKRNDNLLLVKPLSEAESGLDTGIIKEKLESRFPITFECVQSGVIGVINSSKAVDIAAVNYLYTSVMPYPMLSGGFFSEDHQKRAAKVAVLNEKAAFDLFGGISVYGNEVKISGLNYTVVGVIRDDSAESLRVYIPISCTELRPNAFMIRLDASKGVSAEYVMNECKQAGISEARFDFIDLGTRAGRVEAMYLFAVMILAGVGLAFILRFIIMRLAGLIGRIRTESRQYYAISLVMRKPQYFIGILLFAALAACVCAGLIWLLVQTVNGFLLYGADSLFTVFTSTAFHERVSFLSDAGIYADALFIIFLAGLVFWLL